MEIEVENQLSFSYDPLDDTQEITMRMDIDSLSNKDKINLLHYLLSTFDFGPEGDNYEAYQTACGVVLKEAGNLWES